MTPREGDAMEPREGATTPPAVSRAFDFRLGIAAALLLMVVLLLMPPELDFALARLSWRPTGGFIGHDSFWLEAILHDGARRLLSALYLLTLVSFVGSLLCSRWRSWRRPLGYLLLAIGLSTAIVTPLKIISAVHCPWSLSEFGGLDQYTTLFARRAATVNPGRCWPGGHASAGFSLLALYFVLRDRHPRRARLALGVALAAGTLFSAGRMLQGAHFLSHNLWTLAIDWLICLLCYRWLLYRQE